MQVECRQPLFPCDVSDSFSTQPSFPFFGLQSLHCKLGAANRRNIRDGNGKATSVVLGCRCISFLLLLLPVDGTNHVHETEFLAIICRISPILQLLTTYFHSTAVDSQPTCPCVNVPRILDLYTKDCTPTSYRLLCCLPPLHRTDQTVCITE